MSYAGTYGPDETCEHDCYIRSCGICSNPAAKEAIKQGKTHYDNGAGWCVGCELVDNRCVVLSRHCPVQNTPEEVKAHKIEDVEKEIERLKKDKHKAEQVVIVCQNKIDKAFHDLVELETN